MMWAVRTGDNLLSSMHNSSGSFNGVFKADGSVGLPNFGSEEDGALNFAVQALVTLSVLAMALF